MIDATLLLSESKKLVKDLIADIRRVNATNAEQRAAVEAEFQRARAAGRTAMSRLDWEEGWIAQGAVAWVLLALQLVSLMVWAIGKAVSTPAQPLHLNAGFSPSGWLAVILVFVLARVFAEGTLMREDLHGTV